MTSAAATAVLAPMEPRDLEAVARLEAESFSDPWSAGAFGSTLRSPASCAICAKSPGGALLGYVVAWFAAGEGEIANLAVAPAARRRGVGARLLEAALEEGRLRGAGTVYLEVRESNATALALYTAHGFSQIGRRRRYYHRPLEDAILLRLDLSPSP